MVDGTADRSDETIQAMLALSDARDTVVHVEEYDGFTTVQIESTDVVYCAKVKLLYSQYLKYEYSRDA